MIPKVEICVDSVTSLHLAEAHQVDRIELCAALGLGGLTPSAGLVSAALPCRDKVHAMIRPRPGDFVFDKDDQTACLQDIAAMQSAGFAGVVIGVANEDSTLNLEALQRQIGAAQGMEVTLHRVFDLTPDPFQELEIAIELGVSRILTSGQKPVAGEGVDLIEALVKRADGRIQIMAGGGVTPDTVPALAKVGVDAVHASCSDVWPSPQPIGRIGIPDRREALSTKITAFKQAVAGEFAG